MENNNEDLSFRQDELPEDASLLIIDDDKAFLQRLGRAMEQRGFKVRTADTVADATELIRQEPSQPQTSRTKLRISWLPCCVCVTSG